MARGFTILHNFTIPQAGALLIMHTLMHDQRPCELRNGNLR